MRTYHYNLITYTQIQVLRSPSVYSSIDTHSILHRHTAFCECSTKIEAKYKHVVLILVSTCTH